ncbi:MAG: MBL fold metallo-hydrolase [Hyphomicrobiales bacterium]|nr:MBL fold metallo-hydrolase [Hyphomicrobiales bacterium]
MWLSNRTDLAAGARAAQGALTRRQLFICTAAGASLICGCGPDALAATAPDGAQALGPEVAEQPLIRISPHVHMIVAPGSFPSADNAGFMSNLIFVVGRDGVMAIDSGSSTRIAQMGLRQLKKLTSLPVIGLINTHFHGDHWLGNQAFAETFGKALPIHAMAGTRAAIEGALGVNWRDSMVGWTGDATRGTQIVPPNHDIDHGATFDLGGVTLKLHHYGVAHTPFDLSVEVVEDRVMCAGDIIMNKRIAVMDDGSFQGALKAFDALEKNSQTAIWIPAHGAAGADVLRWNRELFEGIYGTCVEAVKNGVAIDAALPLVLKDPRVAARASETNGFERNIGRYVSRAYLEAEESQF